LDDADSRDLSFVRDLRTPLRLLLQPLQDLLDSPAAALAPGARAALEEARRNVLTLSRVASALPAAAGSDVVASTAEIVRRLQPYCDAAGVALRVDCPPWGARPALDAAAWAEIVLGLMATVFHSTADGAIEVEQQEHGDRVQLIVAGGEVAARGLAPVAAMVRSQGGSLETVHASGRTRITVSLPRHHDGDDLHQPPQPVEQPDAPPVRGQVLIAEDHAETREYLCHVLERAGFTVDAVADGAAALAARSFRSSCCRLTGRRRRASKGSPPAPTIIWSSRSAAASSWRAWMARSVSAGCAAKSRGASRRISMRSSRWRRTGCSSSPPTA
jgi:hypothetical protein